MECDPSAAITRTTDGSIMVDRLSSYCPRLAPLPLYTSASVCSAVRTMPSPFNSCTDVT